MRYALMGRTPMPAARCKGAEGRWGADMSEQPSRLSPLIRFRSRQVWLDHLVRAGERYTETHGNHYAAAITYFSVLALVPLLMVAFAAVALVLASNPELLAQLKAEIGRALPADLDQTLSTVIDQAITSAGGRVRPVVRRGRGTGVDDQLPLFELVDESAGAVFGGVA